LEKLLKVHCGEEIIINKMEFKMKRMIIKEEKLMIKIKINLKLCVFQKL
jgi:hypothetical protein